MSVRLRAAAAIVLPAFFALPAFGAISLSSNPYIQTFDGTNGIGTSATATLPTDFRADKLSSVRTVGTFAAAGTTTNLLGGANLATNAGNGIYNFGAGTTTTGPDRAVGFLSSGTATFSGNLYAQFTNTSGAAFSGLQISYNVEKYRRGSNPAGFRIQLFYSTDGTNWTSAAPVFQTAFGPDADNTGFSPAPGVTVPVSGTIAVAIPDNSNLYLAWNYSVASTSTTTNAQALAIDDISVTALAGPAPTNPTGVGSATPASVQVGNSTLLTLAVTSGTNPASTGLAVTVNLSAIGGSPTQQFFDDGTHGDAAAGDNTFSFLATVPANNSTGAKTLAATITDAQSRVGSVSIPLTVTPGPTPPAGTGSATPSSVQAGASTLLKVIVTPGANPTSTGLAVSVDLTAIGGSATVFFDDGTHGDAVAGDNTFSFLATIPANTATGAKTLPATINDSELRSGAASISLTVSVASTPPSGTGSATPNTLQPGGTTLLTVIVTPGANPSNPNISVTADLTSIGGAANQAFFDDGTHGDLTAGDGTFSFLATVQGSTGAKTLPVTVADTQPRSSTTSISLTLQPPLTVKITQVYGGGGNSGSTYKNDFIEIFNASTVDVDITGWSVQQNSANATGNWSVTPLCANAPCVLQAGHYYLVQEAAGAGGTTSLPAPDATGVITMGAGSGKVALVASTAPLNGSCPSGALDLIGYGTGTGGCAETSPTPSIGDNFTAAVRKNNGCTDTDNNANDFVLIGPIPRNRTAPPNFCGGDPTRISGIGLVSPTSVEPGSAVTLTVKVTPVAGSSGIAVSADLTAIGGPASQAFFDDGTHGDQTAGDNVFSFHVAVGLQSALGPNYLGAKYLVANLSDAQGHTGTAPITLTVQSPTCGVERWSVKTGTDADAGLVNLAPVPGTIAQLRSFTAPAVPPANNRVLPPEGTVYVLNATLTQYKKEDDVDYHIVIQDASGNTMITEIPNAGCVGPGSPFAAGVANARAKFDAKLNAQTFFQTANLPVQVKGVAFFDFIHGQTGVAPNGIELHPLLDINFLALTTTTLTPNPSPSAYGQLVSLTVKVTAEGGGAPTGNVTVYDGPTAVAGGALDPSGQATFPYSSLPVGSHNLTASYDGDSASAPSTSPIVVHVVNKANQTISFAPLPGRTFGDPDFSVAATASTGFPVSFSIASGPATVAGNLVHLTGAGTVTVRASQAGDANYNPAPDVDQPFTVAKANQTITFAPLPDRTYGDPSFTVTATGGASNQPVLFSAAGACSVAVATVTINTAGACTVTASQAGDANYNAAASVPRMFTINKAVQAPVTVSAPSDATFGQIGLTATASGGSGTGAYIFSAAGSTACAVNAATGALTVTAGTGTCSVSASRAGDTNYIASPASTPAAVSIHRAASATTLSSSSPSSIFGAAVTFTATVAGAGGIPTGVVTFLDGATILGTAPVDGAGVASFSTSTLDFGPHSITAQYGGDANMIGSVSAAVNQMVYANTAAGSFVIGDRNAVVGKQVTFWGSQWAKDNDLSGSGKLADFKGFAGATSPSPAAPGGTWLSDPGNSPNPPDSVASYLAVIVTSSADKSGSTFSGNIVKIVIVKTDPGYSSDPGHAATGTVVAVIAP